MSQEQALVSIILPVYNVRPYLARSLDSILSQIYRNIEVIAVDDGSTDGSGDMLEAYAKKDARIRVIHKENGGLPSARNAGLASPPNGEFLLFCDSDDWLDLDTVEACVQAFASETGVEAILFPYIREFTQGGRPVDFFGQEPILFDAEEVHNRILRRLVGPIGAERRRADSMSDLNAAWGKCFRREILTGLTYCDVKEIGTAEDLLFNIQAFTRVRRAMYLPSIHYHYNKGNATSIVHRYHENLLDTRKNLYKRIETIIREENLPSEFRDALAGREALEVLGFTRNIMNSTLSLGKKHSLMRELLQAASIQAWLAPLSLRELSPIWKLYYGACKMRCATLVMLMTAAAERLKAYLR